MKLDTLSRLERHAKRLGEIATVLGKYGLADLFGGFDYAWLKDRLLSSDGQKISDVSTEVKVRMAMTELGTTFIKLGQMLSTRGDLVGPALAAELAELQANVPPDPTATARATVEADFGRPISELFAEFEEQPLASASIAQVFGARLHDGDSVVVKILRSGIIEKVTTDLEIVQGLAELMEKHSPMLKPYQPVAIVRQFRRTLLRETDFTYERRNLEDFAENFADDSTVHIPRVYGDLCSRRVVTMERLNGIPGNDVQGLNSSGEDLTEFAQRGANMYLEMVFRDAFYHADPHPGNLMLMPGCVVGVLDCGMVGRIDDELREDVESLLFAIVEHDSSQVTEMVLRLGSVPVDCQRDRLRLDLDDFLSDYVGHSLHEIDVGAALSNLIGIIRRHHITLPPPLALLLKTIILLEGTSRLFSPEVSIAELMSRYYPSIIRRRLSPRRLLGKTRRAYRDWERLLGLMPRHLSELLARMRDGTLTVHLDHRHLDHVINRLVLGVLTAALFLGSSELWSRQAPPLLFGVSVFGALGYLLSVFLGWRLLRAIRKSGNINSKD